MQTETPETPRDRRLSELYDELGMVMEDAQCAMDYPEYTSTLVEVGVAIKKAQIAIIGELLRSHPE